MDANWSAIAVLTIVTGIAMYAGRFCFGRWFNPLSLYSAIWGFCLASYELKLIQYYPISGQAWAYIILAWLSLFVGAGAALLLSGTPATKARQFSIERLKTAILLLSSLGFIGILSQIWALQRQFGNVFVAIFVNSVDIYIGRTEGTLSWLPYVGSSLLAASALTGIYAAKTGRPSWPMALPPILTLFQAMLEMARLDLLMCAVLFLCAYFHTPGRVRFRISSTQLVFMGTLLASVSVGGVVLVSSVRGLAVDFPGRTNAIDSITEYAPPFPSFYANFSAPPVAFSLYLASPDESKNGFWGEYTFAPVFRVLTKLGLSNSVPRYEENYYTPVDVNTSTYLKNIYSDFGLSGILGVPLVLGFGISWLVVHPESGGAFLGIFILAYIYMIIIFSFMTLIVVGDWFVSCAIGIFVCWWAQRQPIRGLVPALNSGAF